MKIFDPQDSGVRQRDTGMEGIHAYSRAAEYLRQAK